MDECLPGCLGVDAQREGPAAAPGSCRVVDEMSLLFDISYTLESSLELREVIRPVLLKMAEGLGMKRGTITILNREDGTASISEAVGLPGGQSQQDYLAACRELIQQVMDSGQAMVVPDISKEPALKTRWEQEQQADPHAPVGRLYLRTRQIWRRSYWRVECGAGLGRTRAAFSRPPAAVADCQRHRAHGAFPPARAGEIGALQRENERLQQQIQTSLRPPNMIGNSDAMRSVYRHIEQVANSVTTVLIRGESGVGKELIARALHEQSPRKGKAFVKFNCAALPESIIESELFGHEKGAFTGAVAMRKGRFEVAERRDDFLDEIGDVSPATQVKLLRVLQESEFERVGGHTPIKADVRILTATSRNLEAMIEQDKFRPDLYYRLNVFPIYAPPLRERKSDILLLADYFVEKYSKLNQKSIRRISTAAIDLLMSYHWPGNVRELENCIERAVLLSPGNPSRRIICRRRCKKKMPRRNPPPAARWIPPWPRWNTK